MSQDTDELLAGAIDNVEDGGVSVGGRELFDEVEGDGMPGSGRNQELLDESKWFVARVLVPFAGDATVNKVFNISTDVRPSVISSEQVKSTVLARVSCSRMVMLELENMGVEVASFGTDVRNINTVVDEKEAGVGDGVTGIGWDRGGEDILSELVGLEAVEDVLVELFRVDLVKGLVDYQF